MLLYTLRLVSFRTIQGNNIWIIPAQEQQDRWRYGIADQVALAGFYVRTIGDTESSYGPVDY
ncbi:hypothetical protein BGZ92_005681 [Podila epicladia]|nr:hypothetical protein BGZ92_005681 [Podila epicladia]